MSNKYLVTQTTFIEGPGDRPVLFDNITEAVAEQERRQRRTKDIISLAEIYDVYSWYVRLMLWLEKHIG